MRKLLLFTLALKLSIIHGACFLEEVTTSTTGSAAIDASFTVTEVILPDGNMDYPYFWSSTTHQDGMIQGGEAVYITFGEARGYIE